MSSTGWSDDQVKHFAKTHARSPQHATMRGGSRRGAGRPPIRGEAKTVRRQLVMTKADAAEIDAAVPEGDPVGPWMVDAALRRARSAGS